MPCKFDYPYFGKPDLHPDYTAHSGQVVKVVRQLTNDECDPECQPMYLIQAEDGWTGHANLSELTIMPDIMLQPKGN